MWWFLLLLLGITYSVYVVKIVLHCLKCSFNLWYEQQCWVCRLRPRIMYQTALCHWLSDSDSQRSAIVPDWHRLGIPKAQTKSQWQNAVWHIFLGRNLPIQLCCSYHKCMFLTNVASFKRGGFRLSNDVSFLAKKHCYSNENINQTQVCLLFVPSLRIFSNNIAANFNLMIILTYSILDNYKDACRLMEKYQTGCNTSDLQSEAEQECGPPYKRQRKAV